MAERRSLRGLYAITPELDDTARLLGQVEAVLGGGAALVQYRHKTASAELARAQAQALLAACRSRRIPLIVNDDVGLATTIGADGVHLGAADADPASARRQLGAQALIGVSCYDDLARAERAYAAGADYVAFGSVYPSPTKPQARRAPLALFRAARTRLDCPLCAIGGITVQRAPELIAAGASLLAVISDLFEAADPEAQARRYRDCFGSTAG